jgi:hypothetical protein
VRKLRGAFEVLNNMVRNKMYILGHICNVRERFNSIKMTWQFATHTTKTDLILKCVVTGKNNTLSIVSYFSHILSRVEAKIKKKAGNSFNINK